MKRIATGRDLINTYMHNAIALFGNQCEAIMIIRRFGTQRLALQGQLPRPFATKRYFYTTPPLKVIKPFILSDIGEGREKIWSIYDILAYFHRYQRSTNHPMVRGT